MSFEENREYEEQPHELAERLRLLEKTVAEFRAVKHDFYNALHTYEGYLELGDLEALRRYHRSLFDATLRAGDALELSSKLSENPPLVSLLLDKTATAERSGVNMTVSLECDVSDLPIAELDCTRVIACLLDNAIEAAEQTKPRRVSVRAVGGAGGERIITVKNSAQKPPEDMLSPGVSDKPEHEGIGLDNIRCIMDKYPRCGFDIGYCDGEMTAVIRLRK